MGELARAHRPHDILIALGSQCPSKAGGSEQLGKAKAYAEPSQRAPEAIDGFERAWSCFDDLGISRGASDLGGLGKHERHYCTFCTRV